MKSLICALQNGGGKCFAQVVVLLLYPMYSVLLWLFAVVATFFIDTKVSSKQKVGVIALRAMSAHTKSC